MTQSPSIETLQHIITEYDLKLSLAVKTFDAMQALGQNFTMRTDKECTTLDWEDLFYSMYKMAVEALYQISFAPIVDLEGNIVYKSPMPLIRALKENRFEKRVIEKLDARIDPQDQ